MGNSFSLELEKEIFRDFLLFALQPPRKIQKK